MKFVVQRRWPESQSVMGQLLINDIHECYTLEPPMKTDGSKPRAIPAGTYDLTIRWSQKFGRMMPHIENVPDFDGVLIHWGNFPKDTEGCTLVGSIIGTNFVGHSRTEFDTLYLKIKDAVDSGPQVISYVDPPAVYPDVDGEISV